MLAIAAFTSLHGIAKAITFDGATTYQTMDGVGVNVNYRSWGESNIQSVVESYIDEAGASLFRLTFDLSDWEASNDDADSTNYNWSYYNPIYSSPPFTKLWDMLDYLNTAGYSNRVILTFMGWGPAWMMDSDGRSLKPGMEDEWAEMISSALIYARNTRGLPLSLVTPNNEPDIYDEGIRITSAEQYTNAMHRLVAKLDAANLTNLWLVGPCRASGPTQFLPEMAADPLIMSRLKHFSFHAYDNTQDLAGQAVDWVTNSAYSDRSVWVTEFNMWCPNCDTTDTGFFNVWDNGRRTAEHLFHHLQGGVSAALAWEGYDSVYAHHYTNWGYFGLVGVDDTNAPIKTYTPRKSFYTVAQVSKWVRPGAERIDVSEPNLWPLTYLTAFKHVASGQVTISGVNVSSQEYLLDGQLANLPALTNLSLYYTTGATNLAFGGYVSVDGSGAFEAGIPANSVFTLVGYSANPLANSTGTMTTGLTPGALAHFYLNVTNPVARVQFDVLNPTADVSLFVDRDHPSDGETLVPLASRNPGAVPEQVVLRSKSSVKTLAAGRWFASIRNEGSAPADFEIKVTQLDESGLPLRLNASVGEGQICLSWNSLPGAAYVVERSTNASVSQWHELSGTIIAPTTNSTFCLPETKMAQYFRLKEGVSVGGF